MSDSTPIVSIKDLYHRYGKDWAVKDISFEISENSIVGLLGSNGAGKSTTMNSLCGIIAPSSGSLKIDGCSIKEEPIEAKKKLGFLPQTPPLYLNLTVEEYLFHCGRLRGISSSNLKASVTHVMDYCGVTEYQNRLIGNLSGGYRQRVGIAQAIIHKPKLVVLDEPTVGLDPVQIREVRKLIRDISKESAILISTHIMSEVQAICSDIIMIEKGTIVFEGTIKQFNELIQPSILMLGMHSMPGKAQLKEIEAMDGVNSLERIDENHLRINVSGHTAPEANLVEMSVKHQWDLFELYMEKVSLDSVFAKLSNRQLRD